MFSIAPTKQERINNAHAIASAAYKNKDKVIIDWTGIQNKNRKTIWREHWDISEASPLPLSKGKYTK